MEIRDKDKRKDVLKGFSTVKHDYQGSVWVRDISKGVENDYRLSGLGHAQTFEWL